jgi:hypothetical protein
MLASLARFVNRPRSLGRLFVLALLGAIWTYAAPPGNVGAGLGVAASCCPLHDTSVSNAPADDPHVVSFEKGSGRVVIVPRWKSQFVQLIVEADGLGDSAYEAFIEKEDGGGGVTLGPDNLQLAYGRRVGETLLTPTRGRLLAWYVCPERILAGTRSRILLRRVQEPGEVAAQSGPFEVSGR